MANDNVIVDLNTGYWDKRLFKTIFDGNLYDEIQDLVTNKNDEILKKALINIEAAEESNFKNFEASFNAIKLDNKISLRDLFKRVKVLIRLGIDSINSKHPLDEFGQIVFEGTDNENQDVNMIKDIFGSYWCHGVKYLLQADSYTPRPRIDVSVALFLVKNDDKGILATLRLELIESKGQAVFQSPMDFYTQITPDFHKSIENAFMAAQQLFEEKRFIACWRLLDADSNKPLSSVKGDSVSAAASLGFFHLFNKTRLDKEIIVMGAINSHGELSEVSGIQQKMKAIIESKRFDTIVVASASNKKIALSCLSTDEKKGIQVIVA